MSMCVKGLNIFIFVIPGGFFVTTKPFGLSATWSAASVLFNLAALKNL